MVEIETYREGLRFFIERQGNKSTTAIFALAGALTAIAQHHLGLDKAHLDRMAAINKRLDVGPRRLTDKNRALLRQFDDPASVAALLGLPQKLIGIAGKMRIPVNVISHTG